MPKPTGARRVVGRSESGKEQGMAMTAGSAPPGVGNGE